MFINSLKKFFEHWRSKSMREWSGWEEKLIQEEDSWLVDSFYKLDFIEYFLFIFYQTTYFEKFALKDLSLLFFDLTSYYALFIKEYSPFNLGQKQYLNNLPIWVKKYSKFFENCIEGKSKKFQEEKRH